MKVKILYVIDKMIRAGTQRHLVQVFSNLNREEFQPILCCLLFRGPLGEDLVASGEVVQSLQLTNIMGVRFLRAVAGLTRIIRRERIGIVHSYLFAANIVAPWAGLLTRIPVITSRRDVGFWKKPHHLLAHRLSNLLTARITANSIPVRDYIVNQEKSSPDKVRIIYNGIQNRWILTSPRKERREGEKINLGCLGNIRPVKGYEYLLEAMETFKKKKEPVELRIGGRILDQIYYRQLRRRMEELRVEKNVFFQGEITEVARFLNSLDILVLPSLSEGFSNVLLEAMGSGLAVIATDVGGNREVIQDGNNGLLVPPADPEALVDRISLLMKEPSRIIDLGTRARETVKERFNAGRMCRRLEELYREVMQEK